MANETDFPILRDKLALWKQASGEGNMKMRDYHRRAALELERLLSALPILREITPMAAARAEWLDDYALPCPATDMAHAAVDAAKALLAD